MGNIRIILLSLFFIIVLSVDCDAEDDSPIVADSIILEKLNISSDSVILDIMSDVSSECVPSKSGRLYSMSLQDYLSGIKVYIVQECDRNSSHLVDAIGYALVGNDIVIIQGKQIPDISYASDSQPKRFYIDHKLKADFPEWRYFINDGIFARDGESMGWIWHISPENIKDYNITKYGVTAPIRTNL